MFTSSYVFCFSSSEGALISLKLDKFIASSFEKTNSLNYSKLSSYAPATLAPSAIASSRLARMPHLLRPMQSSVAEIELLADLSHCLKMRSMLLRLAYLRRSALRRSLTWILSTQSERVASFWTGAGFSSVFSYSSSD